MSACGSASSWGEEAREGGREAGSERQWRALRALLWKMLHSCAHCPIHPKIEIGAVSDQLHAEKNVTVSEKTDHLAPIQFVQYGPKALQRSRSRDFAISMPGCSTAS